METTAILGLACCVAMLLYCIRHYEREVARLREERDFVLAKLRHPATRAQR